MPLILALSVGWMKSRDMVLQYAEDTVTPLSIREAQALSMQEVEDRFRTGEFDLLLVDYDFAPRKSRATDEFNPSD